MLRTAILNSAKSLLFRRALPLIATTVSQSFPSCNGRNLRENHRRQHRRCCFTMPYPAPLRRAAAPLPPPAAPLPPPPPCMHTSIHTFTVHLYPMNIRALARCSLLLHLSLLMTCVCVCVCVCVVDACCRRRTSGRSTW